MPSGGTPSAAPRRAAATCRSGDPSSRTTRREYRRPPTSRRMRPQDRPFPENRGRRDGRSHRRRRPAASLRPEAERRGYVSSGLSFVFTKIRKVERRSKRQLDYAETEYLRQSQRYEKSSAIQIYLDMAETEYLRRSQKSEKPNGRGTSRPQPNKDFAAKPYLISIVQRTVNAR